MMTGRNRYVRQAHVSEAEFRQLLRLFVLDLEATKVAYLTGLSRRPVNRYFHRLRQRLAAECERAGPRLGDIEVDESYFGPRRGACRSPARHINGIESFWSTAKTRLARRRGIRPEHLVLHLKECEYRFNHRRDNLYRTLLALLRKQPLK